MRESMVTGNFRKLARKRPQRKLLYHTLTLLAVGCLFVLFTVLVQPFYSLNLWLADRLFISDLLPPI
jgi:hypothetical protein